VFFGIIVPLLILPAIYGLVILGLVIVFRKMQVPPKKVVLVGFLVFGTAVGFFTAWLWPADSSFYFNVFGALLGDRVYDLSIQHFGDIISPQAHYTIPWVLRIPQVYVITSIVVYALLGLLLQLVYNRRLEIKDGDKIP
jgi:disulfide bond formation protein DsbB